MALTVSKIHPDLWEEADKAGLLWEQGLPEHGPGYLSRIQNSLELHARPPDGDIWKRLQHTSELYRIGLLVED